MSDWKPASDPPLLSDDVLVVCGGSIRLGHYSYINHKWTVNDPQCEAEKTLVTHWQSLPPLPPPEPVVLYSGTTETNVQFRFVGQNEDEIILEVLESRKKKWVPHLYVESGPNDIRGMVVRSLLKSVSMKGKHDGE